MRRDAYARADETRAVDGELDEWPAFDLIYCYSERPMVGRPPREVTVLPEADIADNYTEWITAAFEDVVDVREVA